MSIAKKYKTKANNTIKKAKHRIMVFIKGTGAYKLKKHLNREHPELKHVFVVKQIRRKK